MGEIFIINFGAMFTLFAGYKFAVNHLAKSYSGIFDLMIRLSIVIGVLSGTLLMPIWLQKSRFQDISIGYFLIGSYVGMGLVGLTTFLEKNGKLKWPIQK